MIGLAENRHVLKVNKTSFIHKTDTTVSETGKLHVVAKKTVVFRLLLKFKKGEHQKLQWKCYLFCYFTVLKNIKGILPDPQAFAM